MAQFKLGTRSRQELRGVHPDLVRVVERAIEITTQDFGVHDGLRTAEEQRELVCRGVSRTLDSRHVTGHAVDLVPYIGGRLRWEWPAIYPIADAVRAAARELGVPIRWGGAWDRVLTDLDDPTEDMVAEYAERCRELGKKAFVDGPHYELPRAQYPGRPVEPSVDVEPGSDGAPIPGSVLIADVPGALGEAREDHVFKLYQDGAHPDFLKGWQDVHYVVDDVGVTLRVKADFLCVGTDEDFVYTPMGALAAERALELFDAQLPTPFMVRQIYGACRFREVAQPWGPPYDHSMTETSRWKPQTDKIVRRRSSNAHPGDLVAGHFKNVCRSRQMVDAKGEMLSFFGFYRANGTPIQNNNVKAHGAGYCDYSHGVRGVHRECLLDGDPVLVDDLLQDPDRVKYVSAGGPFTPTTYAAVREKYQVAALRY